MTLSAQIAAAKFTLLSVCRILITLAYISILKKKNRGAIDDFVSFGRGHFKTSKGALQNVCGERHSVAATTMFQISRRT